MLHCPDPPSGLKGIFTSVLGVFPTNSSQLSGFYSNWPWLKIAIFPKVMTPSRGSLHPTSGWYRDIKPQPPHPNLGQLQKPTPASELSMGSCKALSLLHHSPTSLFSASAPFTSSTGADPERPPPKLLTHKSPFQNLLGEPNLQHYS